MTELVEHFEDRGVTGVTVVFLLDDEYKSHVSFRAAERVDIKGGNCE